MADFNFSHLLKSLPSPCLVSMMTSDNDRAIVGPGGVLRYISDGDVRIRQNC